MKPVLRNLEGILLRVRKSESGRSVSILTKEMGRVSFYIARSALKKWGTGAILPFSHLFFSALIDDEHARITQYEGRSIIDVLSLSMEDLSCWYYVTELADIFYPEREAAPNAYAVLFLSLVMAKEKNPCIAAFVVSIKLLALAGLDPCEEEPCHRHHLREEERNLLLALRNYDWKTAAPMVIHLPDLIRCASYLDWFIEMYGDADMKMKGAFVRALQGQKK
jgi:DNA repair protein RecO